MPSIQVTGQLVDPTTGVEGSADIRIASLINYGQTTKKSISHESTDASGNYDFQLVHGKHLILVKFDGERIYNRIGYAVVSDSTPNPIDLIQLINLSDENPPSELVTELQQLREDTLNDIVDTSAQVLENAGYQGEWASGTSTALKGETWQVSGRYYVALKNTSVDPINDNDNWREVVNTESVTTAQNDIVGGSIFKGSNGETVENGDYVKSGATHLRIEVAGRPKIVAMSPVASGVVSALSGIGASVGGQPVDLLESKTVVADMVVKVPTDYPDINSAIKGTYLNTLAKNTTIQINIESGHKLTGGVDVRYGDYSNYVITSDDPVVYLDASNTGVDLSDLLPLYAGIIGEVDGNPLIFGFYAKMPILACVIDMEGSLGTGVQCAESWFMNAENCGVINAGFRGVQIHGFANIYRGVYYGAQGIGLRSQQAARICSNNANFDNSLQSKDLTNSAIYGSRSSDIEARYVSAKNSGGIGVISRNARITLDDGDLSGAASYGVLTEKLGDISVINTNITDCGNSSLRSTFGGRIHAGQARLSTTGSAKEIDVDQGGMIFVNEATQVNGGLTGYANILGALRSDRVDKLNSWTSRGFVGYTGNDVTVGDTEYTESSDAYIKKFADGTMEATSVVNIIPTGNIAVGDFSDAIVIPSVSPDFVSVHSVNIDCVGRTDVGGGGNRVAVDVYHRPDILIGNEFKIRNTGVQLDGTSNILVVASVQAVVTVKGTWR